MWMNERLAAVFCHNLLIALWRLKLDDKSEPRCLSRPLRKCTALSGLSLRTNRYSPGVLDAIEQSFGEQRKEGTIHEPPAEN